MSDILFGCTLTERLHEGPTCTIYRGYRGAAFNAQFLFTPTDFTTVKPETLDAAEVGFKSTWLGNRLQFNGAFFH